MRLQKKTALTLFKSLGSTFTGDQIFERRHFEPDKMYIKTKMTRGQIHFGAF